MSVSTRNATNARNARETTNASRPGRATTASPADSARVAGIVAAVLSCLVLVSGSGAAAVEIVPLVRFGDPGPGADGTFGSFLDYGPPTLNDASQVAFSADLSGNAGGTATDELLVRVEADGTVTYLAREGDAIPGGTGFYDNLKTPNRRYVMNNAGRVAHVCEMTGTPGGTSDNQALWSTEGSGTETLHARIGDPAPGTPFDFVGLFPPTINQQSPVRVAFYAYAGSFAAHPGHLFSNASGTSTLIAKVTDPAPGGGGTLWQFDEGQPASIEPDDATVAFRAQLTGTPFASEDDCAIYTGSGGALTQVARGRQPFPVGVSTYDEFYFPTINVMGRVGFRVVLRPTSDGEAIGISGGAGGVDIAAYKGMPLPDGSVIASLYNPALSAGNVAAFRALLSGTPNGGFDDEGIYRGDGTVLFECAREGQTVPEGGGEFGSFGSIVAINAQAQVLFLANLRNTTFGSADNEGLYLWDEVDGLTKLVRKRDTVPGSGGVVIDILALSAGDFGGFRSLNDASEAVAILDMDGFLAKDGVYLFRPDDASDVDETTVRLAPTLRASPNPWGGGVLRVTLAGAVGTDAGVLEVFDACGRWIARLEGRDAARSWDGVDARGRPAPAGAYFLRWRGEAGDARARIVRITR